MTQKKTNKKKNGNVPNLRFPGFDGEWIEKKLGDIAEKINSGKTPSGGEAVYTDEGVLFIRSQNVNNDKLDLSNSVCIPEAVNEGMKNSVVLPNDILLNITGASLGRSCVVPKDFTVGNVNQHVCIIRLGKEYNPRFIQPILSSSKGQNILTSLQTGSGREGLNFESIRRIKVYIPNQAEQKKIANFLAIVQDRIDTQNKIIKKLETLIKGLRDILLSQSLRFIGFNKDWKTVHIGDDCEVLMCKRIFADQTSKFGEIPFYKIGTLGNIPDSYIERALFEEYVTKYRYPRKGEVLITCSGTVGKCLRFDGQDAYFQDSNIVWIDNPKLKFSNEFLYYTLSNVEWEELNSTTITRIYGSDLRELKITYPAEIDEQQKITAILSSLDEKIRTENAFLKQYELQKKYMLRNLFI